MPETEFTKTVDELDATLAQAQELVKRLAQLVVFADVIDSRSHIPYLYCRLDSLRKHTLREEVVSLSGPEFLASNFKEEYLKRFP